MKVNDLKMKLIGLVAILCIILFAYSIMRMVEQGNENEILKLQELKVNAITQRDSTKLENMELSNKIHTLTSEVKQQSTILDKFQNSYENNLKETNKLKNEKNYIPVNVNPDDQYIFISDYQYKEY